VRFCGNTKHTRFIHHQLARPFEAHRQEFGKLVYGVVLLDHLDHPITFDESHSESRSPTAATAATQSPPKQLANSDHRQTVFLARRMIEDPID
jgi:hypothetical protein